ncbi:hypothetical protein L596_000900 [Steinernema carpocapsae]|uniref:Protein kinase domain-containing protein n=1 Tax=Steinernema carpocapsae TaxID=34508 RepID=A0A4U8UJR7_STECR|nr:hypothetical protein L596_000900 [Steinernema carpocapsae]
MFYNYLQGMERHAVMKNLRSSRTLPSEFGEDIVAEEANVAKRMILRMLEREPEDRPTVDEILASDDLPLIEVEPNDYQKMFLQITKNKRGPLCKWTFQSLFAGEPEGATTYLFDQMICVDLEKNVAKQNYIELIKEELSECFKLHAFVPLNTPSFVPYKSRSDSTAASPVKVMDESGFVSRCPDASGGTSSATATGRRCFGSSGIRSVRPFRRMKEAVPFTPTNASPAPWISSLKAAPPKRWQQRFSAWRHL